MLSRYFTSAKTCYANMIRNVIFSCMLRSLFDFVCGRLGRHFTRNSLRHYYCWRRSAITSSSWRGYLLGLIGLHQGKRACTSWQCVSGCHWCRVTTGLQRISSAKFFRKTDSHWVVGFMQGVKTGARLWFLVFFFFQNHFPINRITCFSIFD